MSLTINSDNLDTVTRFASCSNYEFLRHASGQGPGNSACDIRQNCTALITAGAVAEYTPRTETQRRSTRQQFTIPQLEQALDSLGDASIIIDFDLCKAAKNSKQLTIDLAQVVMPQSNIDHFAYEVSGMLPRSPGVLVIVTATSEYRSISSRYIQDSLGNEWSIVNDDTFVVLGFRSGERCAAVHRVTFNGDDVETQVPKISTILARLKTILAVVCDPHCCSRAYVCWNNFALMGRMLIDVRALGSATKTGVYRFLDELEDVLFQLRFQDGNSDAGTATAWHGFLIDVIDAINFTGKSLNFGLDKKETCLMSLSSLMNRHGEAAYKLWRIVMAWKSAHESFSTAKEITSAINHSRAINDYIDEEFSDELISDVERICSESNDVLAFIKEEEVRIDEMHVVHAGSIGPANATQAHDHDARGVLDKPRLHTKKSVDRIRVVGGRGQALVPSQPTIGFSRRGKRYRLRIENGTVFRKMVFNASDMLRPLRYISEIGVSLEGVTVGLEHPSQESQNRGDHVITNGEANALICGSYGTVAAIWLWSHIVHGDVKVSVKSREMSYLNVGGNVQWKEEEGFIFNVPLDSKCLERMVMYCSDEAVWVDVFDSARLRRVCRGEEGQVVKIEDDEVPVGEAAVTSECSLAIRMCVL